ncbi:MAG TPA: hypothetical protein VM511_12580 [Luteolibacter sp.]|nr:hypothetical protein [Luteolibacter sp.]
MKEFHPHAPSADINPYATPETVSLAIPEERYSWFTAMRSVYVKHEGVLPPVDLSGAPPETPLIESTRTLTKRKPPATVVTIGLFAVAGFFANRWNGRLHHFFLSILLLSYALKFIFHFVYPDLWTMRVKFTMHCTAALERFKKGMVAAHAVLTVICFAPVFFVAGDLQVAALIGGAVASRILSYGLKKLALNRYPIEMHFSEGQPGWLRITGTHPAALERLREIECSRAKES